MNLLEKIRQRSFVSQVLGLRTRKRKQPPKQIYPKHIEAAYGSALRGLLSDIRTTYTSAFDRGNLWGLLGRRDHADASDDVERVKQILEQARKELRAKNIDELARIVATQTASYNKAQVDKQTRSAFGADLIGRDPDLRKLTEGFAAQNVALIKGLTENMAERIQIAVLDAVQSGKSGVDLRETLVKHFSIAENRAKVIARDQIGKLYGQINVARQKAQGYRYFFWRASGDERVREEHTALDGQRFAYDDPPSEGFPGEPIQCRCTAEPDTNDLLSLLDG